MHEVDVNGVILESWSDPRDPVSNIRSKIIPQQLIIAATSRTEGLVANFSWKMNYYQLARVNQTRVKMNVLDTGNKNPKVETINLAHMWGFEVERAKKTIMTTTRNWDTWESIFGRDNQCSDSEISVEQRTPTQW